MVWAVHRQERLAVIFRPAGEQITVRVGGCADATPVLPGFVVEVASLFRGLLW